MHAHDHPDDRRTREPTSQRFRGHCQAWLSRLGVWLTPVLAGLLVATTPVAAQTRASDLEILQLLVRVQTLSRNVAYLLGPALVLVGAMLYLFTTRNRRRSARGKRLVYGGAGLFAVGLALDVLLNAIAWVVTA
jgi:hypothetical protein